MKTIIIIFICALFPIVINAQSLNVKRTPYTVRQNTNRTQGARKITQNRTSSNGYKTGTFNDGTKYEGYFDLDKMSGNGSITLPTGLKLVGHFVDGELEGQGTVFAPDGTKWYEGNLHNGIAYGRGTLYSGEISIYSENWYGNNDADKAIAYLDKDTKYKGSIRNGNVHRGRILSPNNIDFICVNDKGEWIQDEEAMKGVYTYSAISSQQQSLQNNNQWGQWSALTECNMGIMLDTFHGYLTLFANGEPFDFEIIEVGQEAKKYGNGGTYWEFKGKDPSGQVCTILHCTPQSGSTQFQILCHNLKVIYNVK